MSFIRQIEVRNCRNIDALTIDLTPPEDSGREFMHLILTGPNGSGKTGVLEALRDELAQRGNVSYYHQRDEHRQEISRLESELARLTEASPPPEQIEELRRNLQGQQHFFADLQRGQPLELEWTVKQPEVSSAFFRFELFSHYEPATKSHAFQSVPGPQKIDFRGFSQARTLPERCSEFLLQYLVNKRTEMAYATSDGEVEKAQEIQTWLEKTHERFNQIIGLDLEWTFDRQNFDYIVRAPSGYTFNLRQLSDGHAAVLGLLAEILMRIEFIREARKDRLFEPAGVVVVDELEAHLHLELQEQILPTLTEFFPKVQFIVATHSPAVIASIDGAVVCDLRDRSFTLSDELRGQRYGAIMTDHFKIESDFDVESTAQLKRLIALHRQAERSDDEDSEMRRLAEELADRGHAMAQEIWLRLHQPRLAEQRRRLETPGG